MKTTELTYDVEGKTMRSRLALEDSSEPKPAVVIAHAWRGLDDFSIKKAEEIAKMGYVALAADVYGDGVNAKNDEESMELMLPLFKDRALLQSRIGAAVSQVKAHPEVDPARIAAIGFCFGGLTVLELLRSGSDVRCIVSFHALLADVLGEEKAKRPPKNYPKKCAALFLHGHDDPMVSETDINNLWYELDENGVDWQFTTFGHTMHAFTNPGANDPDKGIVYEPKAAARSWNAMKDFLSEQLQA